MPQTITREMLEIATNRTTGKGHYVLKSGVSGRHVITTAETLCGLIKAGRANKVLQIVTPATMNCVRCKQVFEKHEVTQLVKQKLKEVKMLKTSDGKIFSMRNRSKALKHEDTLQAEEKEREFVNIVRKTLFSDDYGGYDEALIEQFEDDFVKTLQDCIRYDGLDPVDVTLEEYLNIFRVMLVKHGQRIRSMLILYQKLYGTLVPCRNTMEKMKNAGIYL